MAPGQSFLHDVGARNGGDGDLAALAGGRSSCDINGAGGLVCGDIEVGAIIACGAVQILNKEISAALLHVASYDAGLEFRVNTFRWDLELSALGNLDSLDGLVARSLGDVLDLLDDVISLKNLAENDVAAIEPAGDDGGDEELGAVGVLAAVGHAQETLASVLELEVLIRELGAVDGLAAGAIAAGEVTRKELAGPPVWTKADIPSLDHELLNDAVEGGALVAEALLAGSKGTEVLSSLGNGLAVETDSDAAELLIAVGDVEVDLVSSACSLRSSCSSN